MPFIPAVNTVRTAVDYVSAKGEAATNVQHFRHVAGVPGVTDITALHLAIIQWTEDSWSPVASYLWQTDAITSRLLNVADDTEVVTVTAIDGGIEDNALPAKDTIAISTRTGLSGRSRRGRLFHVGLCDEQADNSRLTDVAATAIVSAYEELRDAVMVAGWEWVVASYVSGGVPRATALLTPIISVQLVDNVVDSMRTRKPR